jgi:MFS family permease
MNAVNGRMQSITARILAMKFASEFILIYPLSVIMFGDRGGLSASSIGTIVATGLVLSVLLEVPTGVIADSIPRKHVLALAILSKIAALGSWLAFPFFWGYLFGAACFALGSAFESGALQAYLYGTLGESRKKSFGKFWARVSAMIMAAYTSAYFLASIIGVRYDLLIIISIAACSAGLLLCLSLPLDRLESSNNSQKPKIITSAVGHIISSRALASLLLGSMIVIALSESTIEYASLYLKQSDVPVRIIPAILAVGNSIGFGLFWTLHSWEQFLDKYKLWFTIGILGLFVLSFYGGVVGVSAGLLLLIRFVRILQVQFESNIQHLSNDEARATISSFGSFAAKLLAALLVWTIGQLAVGDQIIQPMRTILVYGFVAVIVAELFLLAKNKRRNS